MKKLAFVAVLAVALVVGSSVTYADNGWATAGKVLTGVLAADILLNHSGGYGYGYGYGGVGFSYGHFGRHSSYGVSVYSAPPAYYYPAPAYYPPPVYYAPPASRCYPRAYHYYRCYPSYGW